MTVATTGAISEAPPRQSASSRLLLLLGRLTVGLVLLYAAYAKLHFNGQWHLRDYHFFFAMMIDSYRILPLWGVQALARILPWFELALGALLVSGFALRWVGSVASGLLVVFLTAMIRAQILGLEINCGCFGNNEKLGAVTLLRDGFLLFLTVAVTFGAFMVEKRRHAVSS